AWAVWRPVWGTLCAAGLLLVVSAPLSAGRLATAGRGAGDDAGLAVVVPERVDHCPWVWPDSQCRACRRPVAGLPAGPSGRALGAANELIEGEENAMSSFAEMIANITPEIYQNLKQAVEIGKWPDGRLLTREQKELTLQAMIAWEQHNLPEEERTGYMGGQ